MGGAAGEENKGAARARLVAGVRCGPSPFPDAMGLLTVLLGGTGASRTWSLPPAGLDEARAQAIVFALRRASSTPQVGACGGGERDARGTR